MAGKGSKRELTTDDRFKMETNARLTPVPISELLEKEIRVSGNRITKEKYSYTKVLQRSAKRPSSSKDKKGRDDGDDDDDDKDEDFKSLPVIYGPPGGVYLVFDLPRKKVTEREDEIGPDQHGCTRQGAALKILFHDSRNPHRGEEHHHEMKKKVEKWIEDMTAFDKRLAIDTYRKFFKKKAFKNFDEFYRIRWRRIVYQKPEDDKYDPGAWMMNLNCTWAPISAITEFYEKKDAERERIKKQRGDPTKSIHAYHIMPATSSNEQNTEKQYLGDNGYLVHEDEKITMLTPLSDAKNGKVQRYVTELYRGTIMHVAIRIGIVYMGSTAKASSSVAMMLVHQFGSPDSNEDVDCNNTFGFGPTRDEEDDNKGNGSERVDEYSPGMDVADEEEDENSLGQVTDNEDGVDEEEEGKGVQATGASAEEEEEEEGGEQQQLPVPTEESAQGE
jgi:hypothetical protein